MNRPRSTVTIVDVARAAGVSTATAARALGEYGSVRPSTRAKVQQAAEELGYLANGLARSMITGRTRTIGAVIADIENPFFSKVIRGIADVARREQLEVILANSDEDLSLEQRAVQLLLDKRVDGLIIAPSSAHDAAHLHRAVDAGAPVVLVDRLADGGRFDSVTLQNEDAAARAVELLADAGHIRIGYISGAARERTGTVTDIDDISSGSERIAGYRGGLERAGIPWNDAYVRIGGPSRASAHDQTTALLNERARPTAIITADSVIALGALDAIAAARLRIPDDISVVTFDDPDWATVVSPPLTVVAQPAYDLGSRAALLLIDRIDGGTESAHAERLPSEIIRRGSVGPPPSRS